METKEFDCIKFQTDTEVEMKQLFYEYIENGWSGTHCGNPIYNWGGVGPYYMLLIKEKAEDIAKEQFEKIKETFSNQCTVVNVQSEKPQSELVNLTVNLKQGGLVVTKEPESEVEALRKEVEELKALMASINVMSKVEVIYEEKAS